MGTPNTDSVYIFSGFPCGRYDPDDDTSYGTLYADIGPTSVNQLTMTELRRYLRELNLTSYCVPDRYQIYNRGRRNLCTSPWDMANYWGVYHQCVYNTTDASLTCTLDPNDARAYYDLCSYLDKFTAPLCPAYVGLRPAETNWSGCNNYNNLIGSICSNWPNNDPQYDASQWLFQGNSAPDYDLVISGITGTPDITSGENYTFGTGYEFPLEPDRICDVDSDTAGCPIRRCLKYADYRSFVAGELYPVTWNADPADRYFDEYADFMEDNNNGRLSDYEKGYPLYPL